MAYWSLWEDTMLGGETSVMKIDLSFINMAGDVAVLPS